MNFQFTVTIFILSTGDDRLRRVKEQCWHVSVGPIMVPPVLFPVFFLLFLLTSVCLFGRGFRSRQYRWRTRRLSRISWSDALEIPFQTNSSTKGNMSMSRYILFSRYLTLLGIKKDENERKVSNGCILLWTSASDRHRANFCFPRRPAVLSLDLSPLPVSLLCYANLFACICLRGVGLLPRDKSL